MNLKKNSGAKCNPHAYKVVLSVARFTAKPAFDESMLKIYFGIEFSACENFHSFFKGHGGSYRGFSGS